MLENRGRTTNGTLEVVVTSGSEYRRDVHDTTYSMDVELPTNSRKLYSFTILIDSFTHPLIMRLKRADETILSTSLNLRPHYATKSLVLVVGNKIAPDFLSKLPKDVLPIISRAQFLPETWYGFDAVKMLILDGSVLKGLRERQFNALTDWVERGGYLVTAGSLNYGSLLEERTRRLLPINILGFKRIYVLNSLEGFCGQRLTSTDPFLILKADIEHSVALLKEDDVPLITQKKIGLGKVIFLAFDCQTPPFTDWTGRHSFWNKILALKPQVDYLGIDLDEQGILSSMISEIPAGFPTFVSVISLLAVYVIFLYMIFRRVEKKSGQRWKDIGYLMAIIAVFSAASYSLSMLKNGQKDLSYNSFLHLKLSGKNMIASSKYIIGLYSLQNGDYRLRFGPTPYPITSIPPDTAEDETLHSLTIHENKREQTLLISLDRWSHRFFRINSMMNFPIRGEAFMDGQDLVIMIENMTPHAIIDCQIYFSNRLFSFGNIGPDKKQTKRLARSAIGQKELFQIEGAKRIAESIAPNGFTSLLEKVQGNLMESLLLSIHSRYHSRQGAIHLFGWIESALIPTSFSRAGVKGEGAGLLEWEIPISPGEKNMKAKLDPDRPSTSEGLSRSRILPLKGLV
ncbi:MAG: hypothetical protein JSW15_06305 [Deltaproteobacteria bacterium]|nr:MAG: hypothetical protein JSW15_06305 [Deltaproteobacteria bacterium]